MYIFSLIWKIFFKSDERGEEEEEEEEEEAKNNDQIFYTHRPFEK